MEQRGRSAAERFSRRHFLLGAGAAGLAAAAGGLAVTRPWAATSGPAPGQGGTGPLVLVTLYGGNDGLNTVVPYTDPAYLAARPTLGYQPADLLDLGGGLALNPKLSGLHSMWKAGNLAVVAGVGYPQPNLSHFASMAIWQTANTTDGTGSGWLGRWLDAAGDGTLRAMALGVTVPPLLRGERETASAITGPSVTLPGGPPLLDAFTAMQQPGPDRAGMGADVASAGRDLLSLRQQLSRYRTGAASGPPAASDLTGQMQTVAALIRAGAPTQVYEVSVESFDTHASEKAQHERLLAELDGAVGAFFAALHGSPHGEGTVLMTYSEFGRRPAENASGGTDHGTAAPLFVAGPRVKGGRIYGEQPSLTSLDANGNLRYSTDFRRVYATVLDRVLGTDPARVLGGDFAPLGFV